MVQCGMLGYGGDKGAGGFRGELYGGLIEAEKMMSRRRLGRKRCKAKRGEGDEQSGFWTRGDGRLLDFRNAFQLTYAEMAALSGFDDCGMRW